MIRALEALAAARSRHAHRHTSRSNFKGFDERTLTFHPQFNLITGENASGKTSILEALSVAAGSWFLGLRGYDTRHIRPEDVRLIGHHSDEGTNWEPQYPCVVEARGLVSDEARRQAWGVVDAFEYVEDGTMLPAVGASDDALVLLELVGLDKPPYEVHDANGRLIAIDRVTQRRQAWLTALDAKDEVALQPTNISLRRQAARTARESGFFSIWMLVFEGDVDMRQLLIDAFAGTRASGCFDEKTTAAICPAPNPDGLAHGGKF